MRHMHTVVLINDVHGFIVVFIFYAQIQFMNDRHDLRCHFFNKRKRPFFQRFRQNRMIGVRARICRNFNGLVQFDSFLHQKTDQFRNDHRRMGVVDLNGYILCQIMEIRSPLLCFIQDQLCRIADHEILLIYAQQTAIFVTVIRVQEQRKIFLNVLFVKIDSFINDLFIDGIDVKQMQNICTVVVSCHKNVVHYRNYVIFSQRNGIFPFAFDEPAVVFHPGIRQFFLHPFFEYLAEKSKMIIQTDSVARQSQCRNGIQKAGCQSSQPPISKGWFRFHFFQITQFLSCLFQFLTHLIVNSKVDQIVTQQFSDQKFCGNIIKFFLSFCLLLLCSHFIDHFQ